MRYFTFLFFCLLLNNVNLVAFQPARYTVKISASIQGEATCGNVNHYKLNLYYTGNNTPVEVHETNLGQGSHVRTDSHTWEYNASQSISYNLEGRRRRNSLTGCIDATSHPPTAITQISMSNAITRTVQGSVPNWSGTGVTIDIIPKLIEIKSSGLAYPSGVTNWNNAFPVDDPIRLSVTPGFPSVVYNWQYSLNGGSTWVDMSSSYNGKDAIDICGKDLFGAEAMENVSKYENISFRIRPPEVLSYKTDCQIIVLDMVPSAPNIKSLTPISPKCFDALDGAITVHLDRKLMIGERLTFFVDDLLHNDILFDSSSDSARLLNLPPREREYEVSLMGYYKQANYEHTTYTDGEKHKAKTTIIPPAPVDFSVPSGGVTHVLCYGNNTGSITVNASGGTAPYTLEWRRRGETAYRSLGPFNSTVRLQNLNAGEYEFYVKDKNDCYTKNAYGSPITQTIPINEPSSGIEISTFRTQSPSGYGLSNGSITVEVIGGFSSGGLYSSCTWTNKGTGATIYSSNEVVNGRYRSTIENIPAGVYTVVVRDQSGCDRTADINLTQPALFTAAMSVTKAITCNGDADGTLTISAQGGVGSVSSYRWYKRENGSFVSLNLYSQSISQLSSGEYRVELEDSSTPVNSTTVNFNLTEPSVVSIDNYQIEDATCHGESNGQITITAKGGNSGYRLNYKNKDSLNYKTVSAVGNSPTIVVTGLPKGEYQFQLYDRNNCYASFANGELTLTVNQPEKAVTILPHGIKNISGYGRSDGALSYRVEGGTPNTSSPEYTVIWRDSLNNPVSHTEKVEDGVFITGINDVTQGKYTLEVMDKNYQSVKNGCYAVAVGILQEPDPLVVNLINSATIDCYGDSLGILVARVDGGIPFTGQDLLYDFKWYQVVNGVDSLLIEQTDSILSSLGEGHYKVFVKDSSTPVNTVESSVFHLTQPPLLVTEIQTKDVSCFEANDGYIRIKVSGGVGGYRLYRKRLQDENEYTEYSVNAPDNTFYLENIFGGDHSIFILDANGCYAKINGEDIHVVKINQPLEPLHFSAVSSNNVSGYGKRNGYITVNINGGTPKDDNSYTVEWKDESGNLLTASESVSGDSYESQISNLAPGVYSVEVKDKNYTLAAPEKNANCLLIETFTITEPDELIAEIEQLNEISCFGMSDGFLNIVVSGGVRNPEPDELSYQYVWYRGGENGYTVLEDITEEAFRNAPAGNYRVVITDHSWLPNYVTLDYNLTQPELLTAKLANLSLTCGESASLTVEVEGGTPPYRFEWNTGDETQSIQNVAAGQYLVYVTDSKGCDVIAQATVYIPDGLDVEGTVNDPLCFQGTNGSIELQVVGGVAPYTYQWSTGATSRNLTNVGAGNYTVRVTDQGNCSFFHSFTLTDPEPISVDLGEDRTLCLGQRLKIAPEVEDPKTKFYWTGPNGFTSTDPTVTVSRPGTYRLLITDSNGCQATDELIIIGSNELVSAEMVVASNLFLNDTIMVVNISNPHSEQMEWLVDDLDAVEIVEETEHFLKVVYKELGYYSIGLRSYTGDCYEEIVKSIHVTDPDGMTSTNFGESIIRKFELYPNTNNGVFTIDVELTKISPIRVRVINLGSGVVFDDRTFRGEQEYSIPYNLSLTSGVYVVLLETASGHTSLKMIVN